VFVVDQVPWRHAKNVLAEGRTTGVNMLSALRGFTRVRTGSDDERGGPTRVCVVGSGWEFVSGISYYTCNMANALSRDFTVSAILMRRLLPRRLYPGRSRVGAPIADLRYRSEIAVLDGVDWYWGFSILRAIRFLRSQDVEVLVLEWWTGTVLHSYLAMALAARLLGVRIVIEFHELLDTAEARLPPVRWYVRLAIQPLLRWSAAYAVHSEFDRAQLLTRYRIRSKPVAVVPHGPFDQGVPATVRSRVNVDCPQSFDILYFGTIRPYKGLEHLVEAFSSFSVADAARFRLTVVGETWEGWNAPASLIEASPHRDRITFVNRYVTDREASAYFERADCVALPYLRSSASGPLHMAMSHGLPVIVTGVGGLREAVRNYDGASVIPPADPGAIADSLLKLEARPRVRYDDPHSWKQSAGSLASLFGPGPELVARKTPGSFIGGSSE
jgi:glycosyltransferase involved in cell wall biosynthesis